jgi:hypothetical protein
MSLNTLSYQGTIDANCVVDFVDLLNRVLASGFGTKKELKRICSFAVELLDNGIRHSHDATVTFGWTINTEGVCFELTNKADREDAMRLQNQAEELQKIDRVEMRKIFQRQLSESQFGAKGGAGLGLIQMLRKGALKLDIKVNQVSCGSYECSSKLTTQFESPKHLS